jgi:hypothetical protein
LTLLRVQGDSRAKLNGVFFARTPCTKAPRRGANLKRIKL